MPALALQGNQLISQTGLLDLRPDDQAVEVARLEALGARRLDIGQGPDATWVVMSDPAGNEFCVLRPLTEQEKLSAS